MTLQQEAEFSKNIIPLKERLIVGLDVPTVKEAEAIIDQLGDSVSFYKIGYQLVLSNSQGSGKSGLDLARDLVARGKKVFLDMKLLDIDNTIFKAVENAAQLGVSMLTLHAYPKAMRAAVEAAKDSSLCLLGVTVLTSMNSEDLLEAGYHNTPEELVIKRAEQAVEAGMGGLVASAHEAQALREVVGPDMAIVTPGIRMPGTDKGDQQRVMTPKAAIKAGASHLVVGRPIVKADDPKAAAAAILEDMAQGLN